MRQKHVLQRLAAAGGTAIFAGFGGAMLAAAGNAISSTPAAVAAVIVVAIGIGGLLGRVTGAMIGGIYGVLLAAFGSLIGGSVVGAVLTILVCAALGGWIRWVLDGRNCEIGKVQPAHVDQPFRPTAADVTSVTCARQDKKELALWT